MCENTTICFPEAEYAAADTVLDHLHDICEDYPDRQRANAYCEVISTIREQLYIDLLHVRDFGR